MPRTAGHFHKIVDQIVNLDYSTIRENTTAMQKIGTLRNALLSGSIVCTPAERHHLDAFLKASNEMDQLLLSEYPQDPVAKASFLRRLERLAVVCDKAADEILAAVKLGLIRIGGDV